jgi:hypothetical protein
MFLPRAKPNWNTTDVFLDNRYHTKNVWTDKDGNDLHPGTGYWVGGNTKVYGAALFRLREQDFGVLQNTGARFANACEAFGIYLAFDPLVPLPHAPARSTVRRSNQRSMRAGCQR